MKAIQMGIKGFHETFAPWLAQNPGLPLNHLDGMKFIELDFPSLGFRAGAAAKEASKCEKSKTLG